MQLDKHDQCYIFTGSTCAVWGMGAVGLAVLMGCKAAGASTLIAIDLNPDKEKVARQFGATVFINPKDLGKLNFTRN